MPYSKTVIRAADFCVATKEVIDFVNPMDCFAEFKDKFERATNLEEVECIVCCNTDTTTERTSCCIQPICTYCTGMCKVSASEAFKCPCCRTVSTEHGTFHVNGLESKVPVRKIISVPIETCSLNNGLLTAGIDEFFKTKVDGVVNSIVFIVDDETVRVGFLEKVMAAR